MLAVRKVAAPVVRRSISTTPALCGATPPLPPFARSPVPSEKLVENKDAIWDDGVAPETALDFDAQHIPNKEGILTWLAGLGGFYSLYKFVEFTDPASKNPAVNRKMNMVYEVPPAAPAPEK